MPRLHANGVDLHYIERGSGEQCVVFSHSYLVDHRQFEEQIRALEKSYRVIAFDHREHGKSSKTETPYRLDDLVRDSLAVIEHTKAAPCHFVGLSTGGFVGMRLGLYHPECLRSLVLMDSSAEAESLRKRLSYEGMFLVLRALGISVLLDKTMGLMFGPSFLGDPSRSDRVALWRQRIAANDPHALIRFGKAIFSRNNVLDQLSQINLPTMVVVGEEDRALPPTFSRHMAESIPGARLELIPRSGHLSTVEEPEAVNSVLVPFIESAS